MNRAECLDGAKACVCGKREQEYGTPQKNFTAIGKLWGNYLNREVSALDVAMLMVLLKVARVGSGNPTDDSFVDLAGYAACGCEIANIKAKPDCSKAGAQRDDGK